jgi:hypothetical protein
MTHQYTPCGAAADSPPRKCVLPASRAGFAPANRARPRRAAPRGAVGSLPSPTGAARFGPARRAPHRARDSYREPAAATIAIRPGTVRCAHLADGRARRATAAAARSPGGPAATAAAPTPAGCESDRRRGPRGDEHLEEFFNFHVVHRKSSRRRPDNPPRKRVLPARRIRLAVGGPGSSSTLGGPLANSRGAAVDGDLVRTARVSL